MADLRENPHVRKMLEDLARCDGACLYWQLDLPRALLDVCVERGIVKWNDDLIVHPEALDMGEGCYLMPGSED